MINETWTESQEDAKNFGNSVSKFSPCSPWIDFVIGSREYEKMEGKK